MIYTYTFNPALDYHVMVDGQQEVQLVNEYQWKIGGKGINVSLFLGQLQQESQCIYLAGGQYEPLFTSILSQQPYLHYQSLMMDQEMRLNVKIHGAKEWSLNQKGPKFNVQIQD